MAEDDKCSICLNAFESAEETTLDCNHRFHTACALHWFRSGHAQCPLCRNEPSTRLRFMDVQVRASVLRQVSRRKGASQRLKSAVKKLQDAEADLRQVNSELRTVRQQPEVKKYFDIQSRKWRLKRRQAQFRTKLGLMTGRDIPALSLDIVREPVDPEDVLSIVVNE